MVSTRQSGRLPDVPDNVKQAWLAAYAGDPSWEEHREIVDKWTLLKREIEGVPELAVLLQAGLMSDFPKRFADGLAIRNAWLGVLNVERVEAVPRHLSPGQVISQVDRVGQRHVWQHRIEEFLDRRHYRDAPANRLRRNSD